MKRTHLLAALFVCACDAKPTFFGTEDTDASSGGETDTVGDGEALRVAWTHELPGYAVQAEADGDGAVFLMTRTYDLETALYRVDADGQVIEAIDLESSAADFTWGEHRTVVEYAENGGYRLRPLGESASATMPGSPDDLQLGFGGALRVAGILGEDPKTAFLDIYTPDGMLAATWTQPYDGLLPSVHIIDDGTGPTNVVFIRSFGDDGTGTGTSDGTSTGTISRVGIDGTTLATRTLDFAGHAERVPLPHPDGWMILGSGESGVWTQVVPADLSEPGPPVFDETATGRVLYRSIALDDGALAIALRETGGRYQFEARRYAFDGTLVGTTLLPLQDPEATVQKSYAVARNGDAVFVAGWDINPNPGGGPWVGWVTRLEL